jgi:hypothetical protein
LRIYRGSFLRIFVTASAVDEEHSSEEISFAGGMSSDAKCGSALRKRMGTLSASISARKRPKRRDFELNDMKAEYDL